MNDMSFMAWGCPTRTNGDDAPFMRRSCGLIPVWTETVYLNDADAAETVPEPNDADEAENVPEPNTYIDDTDNDETISEPHDDEQMGVSSTDNYF